MEVRKSDPTSHQPSLEHSATMECENCGHLAAAASREGHLTFDAAENHPKIAAAMAHLCLNKRCRRHALAWKGEGRPSRRSGDDDQQLQWQIQRLILAEKPALSQGYLCRTTYLPQPSHPG
ncbi:hypothetical protein PIB30_070536 [Stylosanthes scabra]|uniref:Uncharacterized protein n=1 Tax=Stylosanthes scabra TaxID=79078 RepID=A0ABU6TN90_9FABA|nr:hypothetical protein [Stylosanthes scabra]